METLHKAGTGSMGLLDLERLCNLELRNKQGQGQSSFIMHISISTSSSSSVSFFFFLSFPKARQGEQQEHRLLGRSNVPTFTVGERDSPYLSPC